MPSLRQLRRAETQPAAERFGFDNYVEWVTSGNATFPTSQVTIGADGLSKPSEASRDFLSHVRNVYKRNGVVFACMVLRQSIFAEVEFQFQSLEKPNKGKLFGSTALDILEQPWPNGTTGELATRMIQDADLAGNFYAVARGGRLYRRSPDKMHIVLDGNPLDEEFVNVAGYVYQPNGQGGPTYTYLPHEVCHWSPIPDPEAEYRGMSWLTPVIREIAADGAATDHKSAFFTNGATPQVVVKFPPDIMSEDQFNVFKAKLERDYAGVRNAHKTLYLAPGADATVVGSNLEQMDFDSTQGRDETRIAAAAGVPPVIVGLKESLAGSSLNAGNYGAARRRMADATMRPLYRSAAAALEPLVTVPTARGRARLWYDDSKVAFFREDRADAATIQGTKAQTTKALIEAGFSADSVVAAVEAEDMSLLDHTGLVSVQLQEPGAKPATPAVPPTPPKTGA